MTRVACWFAVATLLGSPTARADGGEILDIAAPDFVGANDLRIAATVRFAKPSSIIVCIVSGILPPTSKDPEDIGTARTIAYARDEHGALVGKYAFAEQPLFAPFESPNEWIVGARAIKGVADGAWLKVTRTLNARLRHGEHDEEQLSIFKVDAHAPAFALVLDRMVRSVEDDSQSGGWAYEADVQITDRDHDGVPEIVALETKTRTPPAESDEDIKRKHPRDLPQTLRVVYRFTNGAFTTNRPSFFAKLR